MKQRAEEIIMDIWKKRLECIEAGTRPERIIMSPENYKTIQQYRRKLGDLPNDELEYMKKYSVFELDIYIEDSLAIRVE